VDRLFQIGLEQMTKRAHEAAIRTFSLITQKKPEFAEGWNKRATVYYLIGEYDKSVADCEEVIKRNPLHFGALSGFGMNYLQLKQLEKALEYFQRALRVNPNLGQVEATVAELKRLLIQGRRDTI
jgi:tetratricopeptide (TPR) repeat protein